MPASIDEPLRNLLMELVAIDSVNPTLVPGAAGEAQIARHIAGWLRDRGFDVRLQDTGAPDRPNVIGVLRGTGGGRSLMLNGHVDTVGVAGMHQPHHHGHDDLFQRLGTGRPAATTVALLSEGDQYQSGAGG